MEYENYSAKIFSQQEPGDLKVRAIPEKRENQAYSIGKEESCENPRNLVVIKGAKQILIMLTFVGLGLYDEEDKTLKGLEAIRNADVICVEFYTSPLGGIQNITSTS